MGKVNEQHVEILRVNFLKRVFDKLLNEGYSFVSTPNFYEFKHGNLKFTDDRLICKIDTFKVSITLEHYHIKREKQHPIYWGLQCFDIEDNSAKNPEKIAIKDEIVKKMELKILNNLNKKVDLNLIEPKFGWFAWICFIFPESIIDLENQRINCLFETSTEIIANKLMSEFMVYLNAWKEVVLEYNFQ